MNEKLNQVLMDILKHQGNPEEITTQNIPAWDSLVHLNLVLALEEEFGIEITPEEIGQLYKDYKTILTFVEQKLHN